MGVKRTQESGKVDSLGRKIKVSGQEAQRASAEMDAAVSAVPLGDFSSSGAPEQDTPDVAEVASKFHDNWRQSRSNGDGTFEPRFKATSDTEWSSRHGGAGEVDIANTSYDDLPSDWQAENKAAAEVVTSLHAETGYGQDDLDDPEVYNEVGEAIHSAWLSRNDWAKGDDVLGRDFADLPQDEKDKDIDQYRVMTSMIK